MKGVPNQDVDSVISRVVFFCYSCVFLEYVVLCSLFFVVITSAIDYLERFVSEVTCYVSSVMLNPTHSLCAVNDAAADGCAGDVYFKTQTKQLLFHISECCSAVGRWFLSCVVDAL